jgi:transcriptional regulator with XRE-family HTH domain
MNERERAVCSRVRQVREQIKWSQSDFARELGITRDQLVNIEYECTPLRFDLASLICRTFNISGKWLVTGEGDMNRFSHSQMIWTREERQKLSADALLTEAYDFRPHYFSPLGVEDTRLPRTPSPNFNLEEWVQRTTAEWCSQIQFKGIEAAHEFAQELNSFLKEKAKLAIASGNAVRISGEVLRVHRTNTTKSGLTDVSVSVKHNSVKPILPQLLNRLKSATKERGKKTSLANYLGLPLASVSQWLSGDREPGGETTLRLLEWVTAEEAQQNKNPGSASTQPGRKTRSTQSSYEKRKSSPRRT